jgi:hypothetical protein
VIIVRGAATALLGVISIVVGACHAQNSTTTLRTPTHAAVYAAALRDLRGDTPASWIVIDSLMPARDIDAELQQKVLAELPITRRMLNAFLRTQRVSGQHVDAAMLPDAHWRIVSTSALDGIRAAARTVSDPAHTGDVQRGSAFWMQWSRGFPGMAGYVSLSPASLSTDGASALIHVRVACGATCGTTELRLLRRDAAGVWRTTVRVSLSES